MRNNLGGNDRLQPLTKEDYDLYAGPADELPPSPLGCAYTAAVVIGLFIVWVALSWALRG